MSKQINFVLTSLGSGGAERQTLKLASELKKRGFSVKLHVLNKNKNVKSQGVDVDFYTPLLFLFYVIFSRKKNDDVWFAVNPFAAFFLLFPYFVFNLKFVMIFHTTKWPSYYSAIKVRLFNHVISKVPLAVFVCEAQMDYWMGKGFFQTSQNFVIHNGIDTPRAYVKERGQWKGIRCVISAHFRPEKRHDLLINAISELSKASVLVEVDCYGAGDFKAHKELATSLGVGDLISFKGLVGDVQSMMPNYDALILCSDSVETFSLSVLEAMSCKLPIIISDVGGALEQVDHDVNGVVFKPGSSKNIAEALHHFYTMDLSRRAEMGLKSYEKFVNNYTSFIMVEKYTNLISKLV